MGIVGMVQRKSTRMGNAGLLLFAAASLLFLGASGRALGAEAPRPKTTATVTGPTIWLQEAHAIPVVFDESSAEFAATGGRGSAISLATGDFDQDGFADMVVGFRTESGFRHVPATRQRGCIRTARRGLVPGNQPRGVPTTVSSGGRDVPPPHQA